jgi:hypothetical protein
VLFVTQTAWVQAVLAAQKIIPTNKFRQLFMVIQAPCDLLLLLFAARLATARRKLSGKYVTTA